MASPPHSEQWLEVRAGDAAPAVSPSQVAVLGCAPPPWLTETRTLHDLRLEEVPAEVLNAELFQKLRLLPKLSSLRITGTSLKTLPPGLCELDRLRVLDLSGNALVEIGPELDGLRSLERLNLSGNPIRAVSVAIRHLEKLQVFSIDGEDSSEEALSSLEQRGLLGILPTGETDRDLAAASGWPSKHPRYVLRGPYRQVPEVLKKLTQLEALSFVGNRLETLPTWLSGFQKLRSLEVVDQPVEGRSGDFFSPLRGLRVKSVVMRRLGLSAIPPEVLRPGLTTLDLGGNRIETIGDDVALLGPELKRLLLPDNPVRSVSRQILELKGLREVVIGAHEFSGARQLERALEEAGLFQAESGPLPSATGPATPTGANVATSWEPVGKLPWKARELAKLPDGRVLTLLTKPFRFKPSGRVETVGQLLLDRDALELDERIERRTVRDGVTSDEADDARGSPYFNCTLLMTHLEHQGTLSSGVASDGAMQLQHSEEHSAEVSDSRATAAWSLLIRVIPTARRGEVKTRSTYQEQ